MNASKRYVGRVVADIINQRPHSGACAAPRDVIYVKLRARELSDLAIAEGIDCRGRGTEDDRLLSGEEADENVQEGRRLA